MSEHSMPQRLAAEALGTAVLVFIGAGSVPALFLARGGEGGAPFTGAELFAIATAFGLAVVGMVYAIGKVSGCHINPAVTFALLVTRRVPTGEALPYMAAQVFGAIVGGLTIWGVFGDKVKTAGVGVISYADPTSVFSAFLNEAVGHGDPDVRDPRHRRQAVARHARRPGHRPDRDRRSSSPSVRRPARPSIPPAYLGTMVTASFAGLTTFWDQAWLYIVADGAGAALGALAYDLLATPRKVVEPIAEAVTRPDEVEVHA